MVSRCIADVEGDAVVCEGNRLSWPHRRRVDTRCSTQPEAVLAWVSVEHCQAHQRNPGALLLMNRRVLHSVLEKVAWACVVVVCSAQNPIQALLDATDYYVGVLQCYACPWDCVGSVLRFVCSVL